MSSVSHGNSSGTNDDIGCSQYLYPTNKRHISMTVTAVDTQNATTKIYPTVKAAAKALHCNFQTVYKHISSGCLLRGKYRLTGTANQQAKGV